MVGGGEVVVVVEDVVVAATKLAGKVDDDEDDDFRNPSEVAEEAEEGGTPSGSSPVGSTEDGRAADIQRRTDVAVTRKKGRAMMAEAG